MPIATRTFRIFVSSTFEDLKEERDALQREVWPKLRRLCEQHGARFQAIDLRWGVRDEAALNHKTMEICLREIERCQHTGIKPNFIALLGQRYGWCPVPSWIEASEFEAIQEHVSAPDDRRLVSGWYQRDDNAVPPECLLKPRTGVWMDAQRWKVLEPRLHAILLDAARAAGLSTAALAKYDASATHQEVLKGLGATAEDRQHVFSFCRRAPDEDCDPDLVRLRDFLRDRLPALNLLAYEPGDFAMLCQQVEETLRAIIERETANFESKPALALEIEAHDTFARERAVVFGREDVLEDIARYIREDDARPLVLHGPSGSGKSAVMSQASERARTALSSGVMIRRFIGASPESSSGLTLLRRLCEQIGETYGITDDLPIDFNGVVRVLRERLAQATSERPIVVFLDALDQLGKEDPTHSLTWLAETLPPHCRIVVSTTDLAPALDQSAILEIKVLHQADAGEALDHWLQEAHRQLQPGQRERLLSAFVRCGLPLYLKLAFEEARSWTSYQPPKEWLLADGVEGILDTLLTRLALDTNHGPLLVGRSLGYLAASRYGLTEDEMVDVLSADEQVWQDFQHRAHHTPPERRLPVVVWSRLYFDLSPYMTERSAPGGAVISFYHRQLAERAAARFLVEAERLGRHESLAHYFEDQADPYGDRQWLGKSGRAFTELPYHLLAFGDRDACRNLLCDLRYLDARCATSDVPRLLADFQAALAALAGQVLPAALSQNLQYASDLKAYAQGHSVRPQPPAVIADAPVAGLPADVRSLSEFSAFIRHESHNLSSRGQRRGYCIQQAYNYGCAGAVVRAAEELIAAGSPGPALLLTQRCREDTPRPSVNRLIDAHSEPITCIAVSYHARIIATTAGFGFRTSSSRPITVRRVHVWDSVSGACLHVFETEGGSVTHFVMSPDGRTVVAGDNAGGVRIWETSTGRCVRSFLASGPVVAVAMSLDEKIVGAVTSSARSDCEVLLWDVASTHSIFAQRIKVHDARQLWISPDATLLIVTGEYDCVVWNTRRPEQLHQWEADTTWTIECERGGEGDPGHAFLAVTPDGRKAVSTGHDCFMRVWIPEQPSPLKTLPLNTEWCSLAAISANGDFLVCVAQAELQIRSVSTGEVLRSLSSALSGPSGSITALALTPDISVAVTGTASGTVEIWDLACVSSLQSEPLRSSAKSLKFAEPRAIYTVHDNVSEGRRTSAIRVWETSRLSLQSEVLVAGYRSDFVAVDSKGSAAALGRVFSSDHGTQVVISGYGAELVDLRSGARRASFSGHKWPVTTACFVPGGQELVLASEDCTCSVWAVSGVERLRLSAKQSYSITAIDVSPDGCLLATGEDDLDRMYYETPKQVCAVRIWDLLTGSLVRALAPLTTGVSWLAFTPSGRRIVATGFGETVIWDVRTGEVVATLPTLHGVCGIHPSEQYLIAAGSRWIELFDLIGNSTSAVLPSSGQLRAEANGDYLALAMEDGPLLVYGIHQASIDKIPSFITANMESNEQSTGKNWGWSAILGIRPTAFLSSRCPICGDQFRPPRDVGAAIASHQIDNLKIPILELGTDAWDDGRLVCSCPGCRRPLRFNPFAA